MKPFDQILDEEMGGNPPDFEDQYGAGTTGEQIAATTWMMAINTAKALYLKHQPSEVGEDGLPPTPRDEGSD